MAKPDWDLANRDLGHLFGFSASELAANRDGRIAGRQRLRLLVRALCRMAIAAPFVLIAVSAAVYTGLNGHDFWPVAISAVAAMIALYLSWRGFSFAADAVDGEVSVVEGSLETKEEGGGDGGPDYYAIVGELKKRTSGGVYEKLPAGLTCRAYYAPAASALLSIEPSSVAAPVPSRRFGPSTAHSMARGTQTMLLLAVGGVVAIGLGAQLFAEAQPATFSAVSGPISGFREDQDPDVYYVSVAGYGEYQLRKSPTDFSPPLPDLSRLSGTTVFVYLDDRSGEVVAVYVDRMYRTDLFADPAIQERNMKGGGIIAVFLGLLFVAPLLIAAAVEAAVRFPAPSQRRARRAVAELERPEVAAFEVEARADKDA